MKKVLSAIIALAMLATLSVSALAAEIDQDTPLTSGNTAISFNVDPTYTVTIPATITLDKQTDGNAITYEKELIVSAAAGVRLVENTNIIVKLASDFEFTAAAGTTLPYTVTVSEATIANNGTIATFGTAAAEQSSVLHISAADPTYAGTYIDTVTFTVSVE